MGERLADGAGWLSAAAAAGRATGAQLAWIPRRAGDRGALEAGCLPGLLPGGRPVSDPRRAPTSQAAWGVEHLPANAGKRH